MALPKEYNRAEYIRFVVNIFNCFNGNINRIPGKLYVVESARDNKHALASHALPNCVYYYLENNERHFGKYYFNMSRILYTTTANIIHELFHIDQCLPYTTNNFDINKIENAVYMKQIDYLMRNDIHIAFLIGSNWTSSKYTHPCINMIWGEKYITGVSLRDINYIRRSNVDHIISTLRFIMHDNTPINTNKLLDIQLIHDEQKSNFIVDFNNPDINGFNNFIHSFGILHNHLTMYGRSIDLYELDNTTDILEIHINKYTLMCTRKHVKKKKGDK